MTTAVYTSKSYEKITPPTDGGVVQMVDGEVKAPPNPIIPYIEGDGIGPDIWAVTERVLNAAVEKAYGGDRRLVWFETYAGEKANDKYGEWLPDDTLKAMAEFKVAIKGPLTTPVGGGMRSLNVAIRQKLDLYACVRPVRWFEGVPSPVKDPRKLSIVIFRENTEDVYSGIEWKEGTPEVKEVIDFINARVETPIPADSGIGIKPISIRRSKRLVRKAIRFALENKLCNIALVHKGNIMKYTEGAFRDWGYEVAAEEFGDQTITESDVYANHKGWPPGDRIVIKDRIADAMFQQILLRPDEYDVLCTTNLNGDYLSDAAAAQVGGLGLAPGANIGDEIACFEATHGTAPKYAGQDKVNPASLILSGEMMLRHLGWREAASLVVHGIEGALAKKLVTYDLERQMTGATLLKCSEFGDAIIDNMD